MTHKVKCSEQMHVLLRLLLHGNLPIGAFGVDVDKTRQDVV